MPGHSKQCAHLAQSVISRRDVPPFIAGLKRVRVVVECVSVKRWLRHDADNEAPEKPKAQPFAGAAHYEINIGSQMRSRPHQRITVAAPKIVRRALPVCDARSLSA
ncbi:hypothetical protein QNH14_07030 [Apirhabdus apintestini]|nr:hypothetical protein QNH14_19730 [Enterobacteriaceae bacterium CA-0114]WPM85629.1 hypothetical protein QNH14_07030 [Enterobacteriaceae bacterium CA-0114]